MQISPICRVNYPENGDEYYSYRAICMQEILAKFLIAVASSTRQLVEARFKEVLNRTSLINFHKSPRRLIVEFGELGKLKIAERWRCANPKSEILNRDKNN